MHTYIGTYTRRESFVDGEGAGIYIFDLDQTTGGLTYRGEIGAIVNPSFLALAPGIKRLYSVSEIGSQAGEQGLVEGRGRRPDLCGRCGAQEVGDFAAPAVPQQERGCLHRRKVGRSFRR